jgi:diaminopimelate decarboxylase
MDYKKLESLATAHGTPFYVFYPERFARNVVRLHRSLANYYQNTLLAYAFKANYMPCLGSFLAENGHWGEVVSGMEYDIARTHLPGDRLIFNGPCKTLADVQRALSEKALVNLESFHDLRVITALAPRFSDIEVGVRVTFDIGAGISRFGFDYDNGDFKGAVTSLRNLPNVRLVGLHSHFTTKSRSLEVFEKRVSRMLKIYDSMSSNHDIRFINIGGGFFGPISEDLKKLLGIDPPSFENYARSIGSWFAERFGYSGPTLVVEPGVSMVADSMVFVVRVVDVKRSRGKRYVTVDGSVNNLFASGSHYQPLFESISACQRMATASDVVGYTCMEHDVLLKDADICVAEGDFIVFYNRGAYSNVYKPPFICPAPPILGVDGAVYGRRQTAEDILSTYSVNPGFVR